MKDSEGHNRLGETLRRHRVEPHLVPSLHWVILKHKRLLIVATIWCLMESDTSESIDVLSE